MTLEELVDRFIRDTNLAHQIIHGDSDTVVITEGGPVRSFAKVIADADVYLISGVNSILNMIQNLIPTADQLQDIIDQTQGAAEDAQEALSEFKTYYLGNFSEDPQGNFEEGVLYYNTTDKVLRQYNGQNFQTATGADGKTILNGEGSPPPQLGRNGDFYIDTENLIFFGPKINNVWDDGVSISFPSSLGSIPQGINFSLRSGSSEEIATYIGAPSELIVNTSENRVVVSDGITVGGTPLARQDETIPSISSYSNLRNYRGNSSSIILTGLLVSRQLGLYGTFYYDPSDNISLDNGGTIIVDVLGRRWKRVWSSRVDIRWFGAVGDGVSDETSSIQASIDYIEGLNGGVLYIPKGEYKVSTENDNFACLWIKYNNLTVEGEGVSSMIFTTVNSHIPIHASNQKDISSPNLSGPVLEGFCIKGVHIQGTGQYVNYPLAKGRGILIRRAKNCQVSNNFVSFMSMIGICIEGGQGYFDIQGNRVSDCRYTAINFNGRAYQSIIRGNICTGSNANVNSVSIQVNGPCIVIGNTVYGDVTNYANCGGIMWGEGNHDSAGVIANNLVYHCRFGIKTVFHSNCNITGNTIVNCRTTGGITLIGGTSSGFPNGPTHHNVVGNTLINNGPYQIESSAAFSNISDNNLRNITSPTSPSAQSEPDALFPVTIQAAIRIRAQGCSVNNNHIDGAVRGIVTTIGQIDGAIYGNTLLNCIVNYAMEGDTSGQFITVASRQRRSLGGSLYVEDLRSTNIPTMGYFPQGSEWKPQSFGFASMNGAYLFQGRVDSNATEATSGATSIILNNLNTITAGLNSKIGLRLDNGSYHWSNITSSSTSVVEGNTIHTIIIANEIPAGRSLPVNSNIYINVWRPWSVAAG